MTDEINFTEVPENFVPGVPIADPTDMDLNFGGDEPVEDELADVEVPTNEIRIFLPSNTVTVEVDEPIKLADLFAQQHIDTVGFTVWVNEVPVTTDLIVPPGTIISMSKVNKGG
jgi:sulfur carrier protein ThiS